MTHEFNLKIDKSWTLFLDRDGVINKKLENNYVKTLDEFQFIHGVLPALKILKDKFGLIIIVTNQQGIGKKLMDENSLEIIHNEMLTKIRKAEGNIDKIYFCPDLEDINSTDRKPAPGMALKAKNDFPQINFYKSIMVGDSISDIMFGKKMNMVNVFLSNEKKIPNEILNNADYIYSNLYEFSLIL